MTMRRKILPFILGGALAVAAVGPAAANQHQTNAAVANGLVGIVVQAVLNNVDLLNNSLNDVIEVNINDSLNNLLQNALQNADIDVLTNSLNNVLNNLTVDVEVTDVTVIGDSIVVTLLGGDTIVIG